MEVDGFDAYLCERLVREFSTNLVIACVRDGGIVRKWVGAGAAEVYGYDSEELESNPMLWLDVVHPADKARVSAAFDRLMSGESFVQEYRIFRSDGQMQWVRDCYTAACDSEGSVVRLIGLATGVSSERADIDNLLQFKNVLDAAPSAAAIGDLSGQVLYCNDALARILGFESPDEMIGMNFVDVVPEQRQEELAETVLPMVIEGPWSGELTAERNDGSLVEISASTNVLRDIEGAPVAIYALVADITERTHAEEEMVRLRSAVESASEGIGLADVEGNVIYINPALERMLGYSLDEYTQHWGRMVFVDRDLALREVGPTIVSGRPWHGEVEMRHKDGTHLICELHSAPVLDREDRLIATMAIMTDITDRKLAEEALRQSEERYHTVADFTYDWEFWMSPEMKFIYVSPSCERITGYKPSEFLSDPDLLHAIVHPDDREAFENHVREAMVSREALAIDFRIVRADGDERWIGHWCQPVYGADGEMMGRRASNRDITDQKLAEEALRESEQKYRELVENVDAMVFRMDPEMRPLALRGRVAEKLGYTADEIMNNIGLWLEMVHPDDIVELPDRLSRIAAEGKPSSVEMRIVTRWGETRWMRNHVTPQFDAEGRLTFYDCVTVDITEEVETREREAKQASRMAALAEISQDFASSLDFTEILRTATKRMADELSSICAVISIDPDSGRLSHLVVHDPEGDAAEELDEALEKAGLSIGTTFGEGEIKARIMRHVKVISPQLAELAEKAHLGPGMMVPIATEGEVLCLMTCVRREGEPEFEEEDLWFLTEVASHVVGSLTNASLYERQAKIAGTLQRSFIPTNPKIETLDIATCYLPALVDAEIGGDFFDIIEFGGGKVGLVVGDVSGKGMQAAVRTAEAKYMLRGFASESPDPEQVITALNRAMSRYMEEFGFVTLVYALVDTEEHVVTHANAGHEPPLILHQDTRTVTELAPGGPVLGVAKDHHYSATRVDLKSDDLLFFYTDGVTDVPGNGGRFGYERLVETVTEAPCGNSQELLDHVLAVVRDFSGGRQSDDQVMVLVTKL